MSQWSGCPGGRWYVCHQPGCEYEDYNYRPHNCPERINPVVTQVEPVKPPTTTIRPPTTQTTVFKCDQPIRQPASKASVQNVQPIPQQETETKATQRSFQSDLSTQVTGEPKLKQTATEPVKTSYTVLLKGGQQEVANIPGGHDRQGRLLIVFPFHEQGVIYTEKHLRSCLGSFRRLSDCVENFHGFTAIMDKVMTQADAQLIVNCLNRELKGKLKQILFVYYSGENDIPEIKPEYKSSTKQNKHATNDNDTTSGLNKNLIMPENRNLTFQKHFSEDWDVYLDKETNRTFFKHSKQGSLSETPPRFHRNIQQVTENNTATETKSSAKTVNTFTVDTSSLANKPDINNGDTTAFAASKSLRSPGAEMIIEMDTTNKSNSENIEAVDPTYLPIWMLYEYVAKDQLPHSLGGPLTM